MKKLKLILKILFKKGIAIIIFDSKYPIQIGDSITVGGMTAVFDLSVNTRIDVTKQLPVIE